MREGQFLKKEDKMKSFLYFILVLVVVLACVSGVWQVQTETTPSEQLEYLKNKYFSKIEEKMSNTADSASKLGNTLKGRFDEAKDVYEKGIEHKYE